MKLHSSALITSVVIAASLINISFEDSSGITLQSFDQKELTNQTLAQIFRAERELKAGNEVAVDSIWINGKLSELVVVPAVDQHKA